MRKLRTPLNSFAFGEIDPLAADRTDAEFLPMSAREIRDFRLLAQGGLERRPGQRFVKDVGSSDIRFFPFIFDTSQQYAVGFYGDKVEIWSPDFVTSHVILTGAWDSAKVPDLTVAQYADVMLVFHPDMMPQKITRTGATTFTIGDMTFEATPDGRKLNQPYLQFEQNIALTVSSNSGTATLTTSAAFWTADYVGERIRVRVGPGDYREILVTNVTDGDTATGTVKSARGAWNQWENNKDYVIGDEVVAASKLYRCVESGVSLDTGSGPSHVTGQQREGDGKSPMWLYLNSGPTFDFWEEPAMSVIRGYPSYGKFEGNRLWLAGSAWKPSGIWGSQAGAFFNFDLGDGFDADSIAYGVTGDAISRIKYIVGSRHLQVFTDRGEYFIPQEVGKPISPSNFDPKRQTPYGVADVEPKMFDGATLFVDKSGKAIREFLFEDKEKAYQSQNVAKLSQHLIRNPVDLAVIYGRSDLPEPMAFAINDDGTMAVLTSQRTESVAGWVLWATDGNYLQIFTLDDNIYVLVERVIDGVTKYYIEALDPDYQVDSGLKLTNGSEITTWTGLDHLEGKTVHATSTSVDGTVYVGSKVVSGGSVTLDFARDNVQIGLNYVPRLKLHKPDYSLGDGTLRGRPRRVGEVSVDVQNAGEFSIDGTEVIVRTTETPNTDPALLNGLYEFRGLGWSNEGYTELTQEKPLPLTIISMAQEVAFR